MTSKGLNTFLNHESDNDILKAQYVIISSKIRVRKPKDNIIQAKNILFPDANVCAKLTYEDMETEYFKQLEQNRAFLATLIKGSIDEKFNIIFLCTKNEGKLKYLEMLAKFIYIQYGYPVYEYEKYVAGISKLLKYNKKKVLKQVEKELHEAKVKAHHKAKGSQNGRKTIMSEYKQMSKKDLKQLVKDKGLYQKGMDKAEMLDTLEVFL